MTVGNFISSKFLIGGGIPSPSTKMQYFFLTLSFLAAGFAKMWRGGFQLKTLFVSFSKSVSCTCNDL